jgi:cell division protein FtsA
LKNLSKIIHARVVEIIEHVYLEIKNYGHEEQKKKLIAGIVLTGGGSQLKHLKQLVEYITGMDTRLGSPNEHLAGNNLIEISNPTYATAVGLVMNARDNYVNDDEQLESEGDDENEPGEPEGDGGVTKQKSIFEKFTEKLKKFLEDAEK